MNNISNWQSAMEALPDDSFFNIIRLYLGDVKTPYNKQRLISQLAGFVKNSENLKNMLLLLDDFDLAVLTSISLLNSPSQKNLVDFLSTSYPLSNIYTKILNLTERLFIYADTSNISGKQFLRINPLLEDELKPLLNITRVLPVNSVETFSTDDIFSISPTFLAAFISFIKIHGCSCKADGTLKKNILTKLDEYFPGKTDCLQLIFNGMVNLGLLREGSKNFEFDKEKLNNFAKLSQIQQYSFICVAASSRLSRDGLKKHAQLLIDCLYSIPKAGFTKNVLLRLSYLLGTRIDDSSNFSAKTRFTKLLESAKANNSSEDLNGKDAINIFDRMFDNAINLGLLIKLGKNHNGENLYTANENLLLEAENPGASITGAESDKIPVLNIDSTFTVSVMPGLNLKQLLPLTSFMVIKNCNIVTEFEISKKSVSFAFDEGLSPQKIFEQISKYSLYDMPQNLQISIEDWYNTYSSAMIYKGYVLKVSADNISFVENNPKINYLIKEKLAEGIYLLSIPDDVKLELFISDCGLDFMGNVRTAEIQKDTIGFPLLRSAKPLLEKDEISNQQYSDFDEENQKNKMIESLTNDLLAEVSKMNILPQQKENLSLKIKNKKIISSEHLKTTSLKTEILETDGMDFAGKMHLIEAAISKGDLVEIQLPAAKTQNKFVTFIGKPLQLIKQTGEPFLNFRIETGNSEDESNDPITITVSKITYIKRLRF